MEGEGGGSAGCQPARLINVRFPALQLNFGLAGTSTSTALDSILLSILVLLRLKILRKAYKQRRRKKNHTHTPLFSSTAECTTPRF